MIDRPKCPHCGKVKYVSKVTIRVRVDWTEEKRTSRTVDPAYHCSWCAQLFLWRKR